MTLNVTLGQSTPLVVKLGSPTAPGAITPTAGNATLGDFLYNNISPWVKNQIVKSATPRRVELQATAGQPAFVSVGGRWGVVATTIFVDNAVGGFVTRYLFADLSANNNTFVLALAASPVPGAYQMLLGQFADTGAALYALDTSVLGFVQAPAGGLYLPNGAVFAANSGVNPDVTFLNAGGSLFWQSTGAGAGNGTVTWTKDGWISLAGTVARISLNDQAGGGQSTRLERNGDFTITDSGTGQVMLRLNKNASGIATFPNAVVAASETLSPAAGTVGSRVAGPAVPTTNLVEWDATALAGAQKTVVDKNGHLAASGGTPTFTLFTGAGTGAGTVPGLVIAGNDQSGLLTLTTGTQVPAGGGATILEVTFAQPYAVKPGMVMLQAGNVAAQGLAAAAQPIVLESVTATSHFFVTAGVTALAISTVYVWKYLVL